MTRDVVRVFENTPPAEIAALLESKRISAKAAVSVPPRYSTAARITPPAVGDEIRKDNHAASGQRLLGFERERDVGALGDEAGQQRRVSIGATLSARRYRRGRRRPSGPDPAIARDIDYRIGIGEAENVPRYIFSNSEFPASQRPRVSLPHRETQGKKCMRDPAIG
jgi:hypothetical protein